jgi:hypothetical protein
VCDLTPPRQGRGRAASFAGSWSGRTDAGSPTTSSTTSSANPHGTLEDLVGSAVTEEVRQAITLQPQWGWVDAIDADGRRRDDAQVAEITDILGPVSPLVCRISARSSQQQAPAGRHAP